MNSTYQIGAESLGLVQQFGLLLDPGDGLPDLDVERLVGVSRLQLLLLLLGLVAQLRPLLVQLWRRNRGESQRRGATEQGLRASSEAPSLLHYRLLFFVGRHILPF